jgi:hypothetical protein
MLAHIFTGHEALHGIAQMGDIGIVDGHYQA